MKNKLLGGLFLFLAVASLGAISQVKGSAVGGSLLLAVIFGFLGLKQLGIIKSSKKGKASGNGPIVLTTAGSDKYHRNSSCQHIKGKQTFTMSKELARSKGFTPCKTCYPRGDQM